MKRQSVAHLTILRATALLAVLGAVAFAGCYTQLAIPPSPDVTRSSLDAVDGEDYFPPARRTVYPEDYLYDPYYSGLSYYSNGYDYGSTWGRGGYGSYYNDPWWMSPRYGWGGTSAMSDSTREQRRSGRQLWNSGTRAPLPPPTGASGDLLGGSTNGGPQTSPSTDSTQTQEKKKKGTGRRLWR